MMELLFPVFGVERTPKELKARFGLKSKTITKCGARVCWSNPKSVGREIEKVIGKMWMDHHLATRGVEEEGYEDGEGI